MYVKDVMAQKPAVEGGSLGPAREPDIFERALNRFYEVTRTGPNKPEQVGDVRKAREWVIDEKDKKGDPVTDEFIEKTGEYPAGEPQGLGLTGNAVRLMVIILVAAVGFVAVMQLMPAGVSKYIRR